MLCATSVFFVESEESMEKKRWIYLDHAATTPLSPGAFAAMKPYLFAHFANSSSSHGAGQESARGLVFAREELAQLLSCQPRELVFCSGGTEADNQALWSGFLQGKKQGRSAIITSSFEHEAILKLLPLLEREGARIHLLSPNAEGQVLPEALEKALAEEERQGGTALVSLMMVNNELGTIQDVAQFGRLAHKYGALMHTDAVQAVGHLPLSLAQLPVDFLSLSSHKFNGPKGVGALFCRQGTTPLPLIYGGGQERGLRSGTANVPGIAGMVAALREHLEAGESEWAFTRSLRDRLIRGLKQIPGLRVTGEGADRAPGHVHVSLDHGDHDVILYRLNEKGICASAASACQAGANQASHVLVSMGFSEERLKSALRFSLGPENTEEEIEATIQAMQEICGKKGEQE